MIKKKNPSSDRKSPIPGEKQLMSQIIRKAKQKKASVVIFCYDSIKQNKPNFNYINK